ncbi:MAG: phytanoyl-CoA dioxygenase family protein [Acidobacteria bacterium]|nr:phytanoyl-CoA dioxygenase family protein [Acidobacteriota bacterium]
MDYRILTDQEIAQFHRDGYVLARSLFDASEMELLHRAREIDSAMKENVHAVDDREGGTVKLALWNEAGGDIYGLFSRSRRIVDSAERLLGGEVYHWHSKMVQKEPYVGGAWTWHQDYGYWYYDACLFPEMLSVMIAVDPANQENGCLQVLKGSHRLGRIDHNLGKNAEQAGANLERVEAAKKVLELVYCEMEIGDALFFHCNLLHRSDQNRSPRPRWALISCYNLASNTPYKESRHAAYAPLEKVPDEAIKEFGLKLEDKSFYQGRGKTS